MSTSRLVALLLLAAVSSRTGNALSEELPGLPYRAEPPSSLLRSEVSEEPRGKDELSLTPRPDDLEALGIRTSSKRDTAAILRAVDPTNRSNVVVNTEYRAPLNYFYDWYERQIRGKIAAEIVGAVFGPLFAAIIYSKCCQKTIRPVDKPPNRSNLWSFGYGMFSLRRQSDLFLLSGSFWPALCGCFMIPRWADTLSKAKPPIANYSMGVCFGISVCVIQLVVFFSFAILGKIFVRIFGFDDPDLDRSTVAKYYRLFGNSEVLFCVTFLSCVWGLLWSCRSVIMMLFRQRLRRTLGLVTGGTTCVDDCAAYCFCEPCALVQDAREVEYARSIAASGPPAPSQGTTDEFTACDASAIGAPIQDDMPSSAPPA